MLEEIKQKNKVAIQFQGLYKYKAKSKPQTASISKQAEQQKRMTFQDMIENTARNNYLTTQQNMFAQKWYYKETNLSNYLFHFQMKPELQILKNNDRLKKEIGYLVKEVFPEIKLTSSNFLVCWHKDFQVFYIYFNNSKVIPVSKCCHNQVYVVCDKMGVGNIYCGNEKCSGKNLKLINLNKENKVQKSNRQKLVGEYRRLVSKQIMLGKYRYSSVDKEVKKENQSASNQYFQSIFNGFDEQAQQKLLQNKKPMKVLGEAPKRYSWYPKFDPQSANQKISIEIDSNKMQQIQSKKWALDEFKSTRSKSCNGGFNQILSQIKQNQQQQVMEQKQEQIGRYQQFIAQFQNQNFRKTQEIRTNDDYHNNSNNNGFKFKKLNIE